MGTYMVVATFREGTDMGEVFAVVAEEQAAVAALTEAGRLGAIHVSLERGTVFLETYAEDGEGAAATVGALPMAAWWDLDVFPVPAPVVPGAGS